MNKAFVGILIAVCILGMALIMLTEWKSSRNEDDPAPGLSGTAPAAQETVPPSGASLTPPIPAGETPSAEPLPQIPAAAPAAPAVPTPPAEALERGFAFNDTDTPPPAPSIPPLPETGEQVGPPTASAPDAARLPGEEVMTRPALGTGGQPAAEAPARPETPAAAPEKAEKKEEKKADKAAPTAKARTVTRFVVFARETGATVRIEGSSPIDYKYLTLNNPPRVAVDLVGEWTVKAPGVPRNPAVTNVRLGKLDGRTRVVIDLSGESKVRYILSKDKKRLDVRIDR